MNRELCTGCNICVEVCPDDVLRLNEAEKIAYVAYPDECQHCGACKLDCPEEAIKINIPLPLRVSTLRVKP